VKKWRRALAVVIAAALVLAFCALSGWLLMPVRTDYGATWESYLQEERNSIDVLFFGSSIVYCDVIPAVLWEETGLSAYVMAGPEQTLPVTVHYVREACRTQSPRAVVLEVTGMFFQRYESFTKVNIGYMPWGKERLAATFDAAEPAERLGLLFPLYNYHDRVWEITPGEMRAHLSPTADLYAGYTPLTDAAPQPVLTARDYDAETEVYAENLRALEEIADFCRENGIELILYAAPSRTEAPEAAWDALEEDIAGLGCTYLGRAWPEVEALDDGEVWFDFLHYNVRGAVPFTRALAGRLTDLGLTGAHGNAELWQRRLSAIEALGS